MRNFSATFFLSLILLLSINGGARSANLKENGAASQKAPKTESMEDAINRGAHAQLEADIAMVLAKRTQWEDVARRSKAEVDYVVSRYDSEISLRKIEIDLYNNQRIMEWPIFALVAIIVLASLYLAYMQLAGWLVSGKAGEPANTTALTINKDGFTLNTPFVGLLMLVGAFAFFYMYIDRVHNIDSRADQMGSKRNSGSQDGKEVSPPAAAASAPVPK